MFYVARTLAEGEAGVAVSVRLDDVIAGLPDGSAPATLLIDREVLLVTDVVVPRDIDLAFLGGGCIVRDRHANPVLTIHREPRAGLWQVFGRHDHSFPHRVDIDSIPDVRFGTQPGIVRPEWWGGAGFNGTKWQKESKKVQQVHAKAFQAALDSVSTTGGEVRVSPGTYFLTSPLRVHPRTRLVGDGPSFTKLSWFESDGIVVDESANDIELSGIGMGRQDDFTSGPKGGRYTGIQLHDGANVRIHDVGMLYVNDAGFGTGILQRGNHATPRMNGLELESVSVLGAAQGIVLECVDDVLLDRVQCSQPMGPPRGAGIVLGKAGMAPCTYVRLLSSLVERQAVAVRIVNVDGFRIEGCYFECTYRNRNGSGGTDYSTPSERRFLVVDSGRPSTPALSGEGMDVGFNYFSDSYWAEDETVPGGYKEVVPSDHVEWALEADRARTKVFRLEGLCRAMQSNPGGPVEPPRYAGGLFIQDGDILYNAGSLYSDPGPLGWVSFGRDADPVRRIAGWKWLSIEPLGKSCDWREFGKINGLETETTL